MEHFLIIIKKYPCTIKAVTTNLRYIHSFSFNYVFILQIHNLITKLLQKKFQNLGNLLVGRFHET